MKRLFSYMILIALLVLAGCNSSSTNKGENNAEAASSYPEKDIEIILPFPPGGTTDNTIRIFASVLPQYLPNNVKVVVQNKPGGTGVVGSTEAMNAKPDGYKVLYAPVATIAFQEPFGKANYSYNDFKPIVNVQSSQTVLMVNADSPFETFEDWLDFVKENPGEFTYGTPGTASSAHLSMEALNLAADIQTKMVPFDGNAPSLTSLLGGHIDGATIQMHEVRDYLESGELRPLFYLGDQKYEGYEDVPLLSEFGYTDILSDPSSGIFAPKDLPDDIAQILSDAFKEAFEDPKVTEFYEGLQLKPEGTSLKEFEEMVEKNYEVAKKVIEENNLSTK